jgi:hypothetical protein
MTRTVLAFLFSPLIGTLIGASVMELAAGRSVGFDLVIIFGVIAGFFVYPAALVVGIPALLIMRRKQCLTFAGCLATSLLSAMVAWCFVHWPFESAYFEHQGIRNAVFGAISAVIGAVVFWLVGVRNNRVLTDRSNGQPPAAVELPR